MSYPDLGCFAECLECELCDEGLDDLDLDLDWDDYDGIFGEDSDQDDWGPPAQDDGDWWGDFDPDYWPTFKPMEGGGIFGVGGRF